MKVKYIGESFGVDSLTDGCVYECVGVEGDFGFLRTVDDSEKITFIRQQTLDRWTIPAVEEDGRSSRTTQLAHYKKR